MRVPFPPRSLSHSVAVAVAPRLAPIVSPSSVLSGGILRMRFLDSAVLRFQRFFGCASSSAVSSRTTSSGVIAYSTMDSGGEGSIFEVSGSTVLKILKGDITKWSVDGFSDAIVNPANERMLGGGGADGAIHRAAGPQLRAACYEFPEVRPGVRCPTGEARITPGFNLPASHVIHTVGPIYDSDSHPEESLSNAYKNSLKVAKENNIKYIAFPAISCGIYGYPFKEAASVAISTVKQFADDLKEVHFVLFSDDIYSVWINKAKEVLQP